MHLHFERIQKPSSYSDCNLSSLSWMGKVPDGLLQNDDDGWKLNRTNYYQDGWLACGNIRGIVGVTFTTSRNRKNITPDLPQRTNYNLRGHRSEVTLVKWNEPYQKLASCDSTGIIFVWIKYEGRWSIELINDRNTQVTDFAWSHDGRMALICYMDGFVLVGSVSGQRYWSSMLNLDSCTISCGIWSPDDQNVIFGTSSGHILVIDVHGTMVAQVSIQEGISIAQMSWSCEKFKMDDSDEEQRNNNESLPEEKTYSLAVSFMDGNIYIMRNYDDIFPIIIRTGLLQTKIEWSNNGEILAIAGHQIQNSVMDSNGDRIFSYKNIVQFYTFTGVLRLKTEIKCTTHPITAITWGHSDKRLFTAVGPILYIAWITKRIPSLHLLSRLSIYNRLSNEQLTQEIPLPQRLQSCVANLFSPTLQCYLPDLNQLKDFVCNPPKNNVRLHCTMVRHEDDLLSSSTTYILYLEYLGGLVPILKGKRASKLKPEFIIFNPQNNCITNTSNPSKNIYNGHQNNGMVSNSNNSTPYATSSDSEADESFSGRSPQTRRRRRFRRHFRSRSNESSNTSLSSNSSSNGCVKYIDEMPEQEKLVLVTSNIWGTKFKILGLSSWLPSQLGSINYRTSLLHLQPRQMTLSIKELGEKRMDSSFGSINKLENNNNVMSSDSEDEMAMSYMMDNDISAPIAPMSPKKSIRCNTSSFLGQTRIVSPEKRATYQLHSSGGHSSSDFPNFTEELLTLQISGDSHLVSMEMSGPTHTRTATTSSVSAQNSTISTQTSFQSITELLNSLTTLEKNTQTLFSPLIEKKSIEEQTEETFSRIAKRFASELPQSYYTLNTSKGVESLHSPALINLNSDLYYSHLTTASYTHSTDSPNVSPPKGIRYKITKKESPRKASVSCIESDLTPSPKSQRRYPVTSTIITSGPSASTWGAVSVLHCNNSLQDSLSFDSKSMVVNDFRYIDDMESVEDSGDQKSTSVFQKNRSICHMQSTVGSDFTNVRNVSESAISHTFPSTHNFQRRLTLKASKQSHSFDICSDNPNQSSEKSANNCRSVEEQEDVEEDEERDYSVTDSFISNTTSVKQKRKTHFINNNNFIKSSGDSTQRYSNQSQTTQSSTQIYTSSTTKGNNWCSTSNECSLQSVKYNNKKNNPFNYIDNRDSFCANQRDSCIPNRFNSSETCAQKDFGNSAVGTDTNVVHSLSPIHSVCNSPRLHNHRPSLPQAIASTSTSINSIVDTTSATTNALLNRSLPASPLLSGQRRRRASIGKSLLYSPMMLRKVMKQKLNYLDCSSDSENTSDDEEMDTNPEFRNLETLQRKHFRKKFKIKRRNSRVKPELQETSPKKQTISYREFVLHNKAPLWNEVSQVYQLDFGGRVTQESAKNFQIEYQGKQVMQFGRIDGNAYTLDFQYPFSALQALAVALANVTQRLK